MLATLGPLHRNINRTKRKKLWTSYLSDFNPVDYSEWGMLYYTEESLSQTRRWSVWPWNRE